MTIEELQEIVQRLETDVVTIRATYEKAERMSRMYTHLSTEADSRVIDLRNLPLPETEDAARKYVANRSTAEAEQRQFQIMAPTAQRIAQSTKRLLENREEELDLMRRRLAAREREEQAKQAPVEGFAA